MITAWHFVNKTLRDGRPVPKDGVWLEHTGKVKICRSGFHASRDPFDALMYAPGNILCLVECDGNIIEQADKLVCRRRRIIERRDATEGLRYFARMQALSVVHLWDAPDVVLDYLMTGDERIRAAACDAAWNATRAAACDAAWDATRAAAKAATWDAAWNAARAAAWNATTWNETRAAAWDAARREFNALVDEAFIPSVVFP